MTSKKVNSIYLTIVLAFFYSCNSQESQSCKMELEFYSRTYTESEDGRFYGDELKIKNYNKNCFTFRDYFETAKKYLDSINIPGKNIRRVTFLAESPGEKIPVFNKGSIEEFRLVFFSFTKVNGTREIFLVSYSTDKGKTDVFLLASIRAHRQKIDSLLALTSPFDMR